MKSFQSCSRLFTQHNWISEGGDEEEVESLGSEDNRTWKYVRPPGDSVCTVKDSEEGTANTIASVSVWISMVWAAQKGFTIQ